MNRYTIPAVGRKRTKDFDLPPKMARKGASYYYVTNERPRRWIPLGRDLAVAKRRWADLEYTVTAPTVYAVVERYCRDHMADNAIATRKQYLAFARTIEKEWGNVAACDLDTFGILQYTKRLDTPPIWANGVLSLLRKAYDEALYWGWASHNPARQAAWRPTASRDRYLTDDEFRKIREAAPVWLATAMDLSYLTALRPSDIVALRWEDVGGRRPLVDLSRRRLVKSQHHD